MMAAANILRRFVVSARGVAAIEFALVLPFLLLVFLASFDAGNAIAIYLKVRSATFALGAITNTYNNSSDPIQATDMTSITSATSAILAPYSSSPIVITITQIKATSATAATVSWSYSLNGTAYAQGSPWTKFPSQLTLNNPCSSYTPGCYLIFAEVKYTFTPSFGYFITGPIALYDNVYVVPRTSTCIVYVPQGSTC